jgi:hypothetical protein
MRILGSFYYYFIFQRLVKGREGLRTVSEGQPCRVSAEAEAR